MRILPLENIRISLHFQLRNWSCLFISFLFNFSSNSLHLVLMTRLAYPWLSQAVLRTFDYNTRFFFRRFRILYLFGFVRFWGRRDGLDDVIEKTFIDVEFLYWRVALGAGWKEIILDRFFRGSSWFFILWFVDVFWFF